jgi:hypothetical protein
VIIFGGCDGCQSKIAIQYVGSIKWCYYVCSFPLIYLEGLGLSRETVLFDLEWMDLLIIIIVVIYCYCACTTTSNKLSLLRHGNKGTLSQLSTWYTRLLSAQSYIGPHSAFGLVRHWANPINDLGGWTWIRPIAPSFVVCLTRYGWILLPNCPAELLTMVVASGPMQSWHPYSWSYRGPTSC